MNRYFGLHILEGEWHSLLPRYLLLAQRVEGLRILDIGCGSGIGASLLLELGASMVDAIDHRPAVLELARMKHAKPGLDYHVMFWEELDFQDDTFDLVLCLDPGSPVTDPSLLQEVDRVLKPGGEYVCAIERKKIEGLEVLLPRYGYTDAAESIDLLGGSERPPQVGELQKVFKNTLSMTQRPSLAYVFDSSDPDSPVEVDDQLQRRDTEDAAVEIWFCGEDVNPPNTREIRLPYFSLVERLDQVINDLQMRQIRGEHEAGMFDEILDDGPSEVFERERQNTNEFKVVKLDDDATTRRMPAVRDDLGAALGAMLGDPPTLVRDEPMHTPVGFESQVAELSALYQQVRHEFQSVVRDAQTALDERDRYIEHLVGTVQSWQDRYGSEAEETDPPTGPIPRDNNDADALDELNAGPQVDDSADAPQPAADSEHEARRDQAESTDDGEEGSAEQESTEEESGEQTSDEASDDGEVAEDAAKAEEE